MTTGQPLSKQLTPARLDRDEGYRLLDLLQDTATQQATLPGLEQLAPGYADWIVTTLFGGTYLREGLSLRDRQLVNLAALTTLGGVDPQLAGHVRTSLRVGMTRQQVIEVFVHLAPYIGVPKTLAGLRVAASALADAEQEPTR
ncbi:carboxymuconolactone decarboxylase family protein [Kibdelosporangium phytohabitans]|uniref:Carboxymuconolactone decarboxylase n=1 Tax=Kibdelosporangium phytohabitans TaxID=860235 RepID=A0A0N9HXG8_9PSEU|nr:carboxymuconolactone decarboxylase family protein [Kibdelosporangium phytohabitans]ALG10081.1 carboxymuconolactone decarboxylase [Kibdelosporangium phytohabitans]MBE1461059.1 4-carboxymuconolactone decarboxylase [Kibdelosporangium phytohabitans]